MRNVRRRATLGLLAVGLGGLAAGADDPPAGAPQSGVLRDGFESSRTAWNQEQTDATVTLEVHDRSARAAHEGRTSEHFRFDAGIGSEFYYSYALPKVPVTAALRASLYVRANRAGAKLFARVILPADIDPETHEPSYLMVPGTAYENVDRWERLEVIDLPPSLERQARVLRASSRRPVSLAGAYVERLVVNLYSTPGDSEVFLDELAVGPVPAALADADANANADPAPAAGRPGTPGAVAGTDADAPGAARPGGPSAAAPTGPGVRFERNRLMKRGGDGRDHDWVPTAIHAPGADLATLRSVGFDVLAVDLEDDPARASQAVRLGFRLIARVNRPRPPAAPKAGESGDEGEGEGGATDPDRVAEAVAAYPQRGSVLAWDLGDRLGRALDPADRKDELEYVRALRQRIRALPGDFSKLTTAEVDGELRRYTLAPRNLEMVAVRPPCWGSSRAPMDSFMYLLQRRTLTTLSNAEQLFWAVLPARPPAEVAAAVWGVDPPPPGLDARVQPEQLRMTAYAALATGYRGLCFEADAGLTRPGGRALLLEMGILNAEIDLCESILANGHDPIPMPYAFDPDPPTIPAPGGSSNAKVPRKKEMSPIGGLRGAAIGTRDKKGVLLVVGDYGGGAQYQPAQMARENVKMTVVVPEGAQAFDVSPGRVRLLERERVVGGTRITFPEFDSTALVLFTTDVAMAERVEAAVRMIRPQAAQMAIEQAELKVAEVTDLAARLAADGHTLIDDKTRLKRERNGGPVSTDQADLLRAAAANCKTARENLEREDFENAWLEARRASRALRVLARGLWQNAQDAFEKVNSRPEDVANEEAIGLGRKRRVGPPLVAPTVGCPPLVAFNTVPQGYIWMDWMRAGNFGRNLIPGGDFDDPDVLKAAGWSDVGYGVEGVKASAATVSTSADGGRRAVKLRVEEAVKGTIDTLPPFLDFPAAAVKSPPVAVRAGQLLRISVWVQRATPSPEGNGGVVIRDSLGGEPLQLVMNEPIPKMTRVVLYRRAPADGELTVTLGLAYYGTAVFDDLKVERVEAAPAFDPPGVAAAAPQPLPDLAPPESAVSRSDRGGRRPR